jgi:carbonic anhydrase
MKKLLVVVIVLLISSLAYAGQGSGGHGDAGHAVHWGYAGHQGPEHWGELSHDYSACSEGENQSPINLAGFVESELKPIEFNYEVGGNEVLNNGHTIQLNFSPGSNISVDGREFELKQYHFHAPSENHVNGESYPMEAHLVHADKAGNLAVVGVMFAEGETNTSLASVWSFMPGIEGGKQNMPASVSADGILPADRDYYRFNGSLTTPPCTEGVLWLVMKAPVTASKDQIGKFAKVMKHPNNRPIQAINARAVLQ